MTIPDIPQVVLDIFSARNIPTRPIRQLRPPPGRHTADPHDKRFEETWCKLRCFELIEYDRVVLLDSDMLMLKNMDELMDLELPTSEWIGAVHVCACNPMKYPHYPKDWTIENCAYTPLQHPEALTKATQMQPDSPRPYHLLNAGLMVLTPSTKLMSEVESFLNDSPLVSQFRFPDQDLLATVFRGRWKPLPWKYNALKTLRITHPEFWRDSEVHCIHYILREKPWHFRRGEAPPEYELTHKWWWETYVPLLEQLKRSSNSHWEVVDAQVAH